MYDTIFITDLHGNLKALQKAVLSGRKIGKPKFLIIGGDIAPNLVTIKFTDGEFVLRHMPKFSDAIVKDFCSLVAKKHYYSDNENYGKLSIPYSLNMSQGQFLSLPRLAKIKILKYPSSFEYLKKAQLVYLKKSLLPALHKYKKQSLEIFIMLGNDDFVELEPVLLSAEKQGDLCYINKTIHDLGKKKILGYSYVKSKPFRYRFWEKTEKVIYSDLKKLLKNQETANLIISFHMPPFKTNLDVMFPRVHIGSKSIRKILTDNSFFIGLFGHIHEPPLLSGKDGDHIGTNLIINPGAFHETRLGAIIFDSNKMGKWLRLK
jgi:Icc-related predicted phosphoesterase